MAWLAGDDTRTAAELTRDAEQPTPATQKPAIGEAPEEREAEDVLLRGQRVLLERGEVVLDFAQFYSRSADHLLAAVGGGVALATIEREIFSTLLLGRVGILEETELFVSSLFQRQHLRQFFGSTTLTRSDLSSFAGMQFGIRRTLLRERARRPDIVLTFNAQVPTGNASTAVGTGLVLVKSVDPVVLFANANYFRTFGREVAAATRLQAKNRVDLSMGYGLALNDTIAISMAVSGVFTGSVTLDDATLRQPSRFSVRFGLTSWLGKGLYIEPSVSFGLAGPGESFAFGVTLPYAF